MSGELMRMLTASGVEVVAADFGSDAASAIGQHWNAVKQFLHTGDTSVLEPFSSIRIGSHRFAVDPAWIERWAARGELDDDDIYESGGSR